MSKNNEEFRRLVHVLVRNSVSGFHGKDAHKSYEANGYDQHFRHIFVALYVYLLARPARMLSKTRPRRSMLIKTSGVSNKLVSALLLSLPLCHC